MSKVYAVKVGRSKGIFNTWDECKKQIDGFGGAKYKSFTNREEATLFLKENESKYQKKVYAVRVGHQKGIYDTWQECKKQIDGFKGAKYKSFTSKQDAQLFIEGNDFKPPKKENKKTPYPGTSSQILMSPYWNMKINPIIKQRKKRKLFLESGIDEKNYNDHCLDIYTDGSCLDNSNPEKMKRRAGYGIYVSQDIKIGEEITDKDQRSNNCAELMAVLVCIQKFKSTNKHLRILTDSKYVCNIFECDGGILMENEPFPHSVTNNDTQDIQEWLKQKLFENRKVEKAWYYLWIDKDKTEYENKALIDNIFKEINSYEKDVRLIHIPGHKKIYGNEKADQLAKNAALQQSI